MLRAENSLLTLARYFFGIAEPLYNFCKNFIFLSLFALLAKEAKTIYYLF